MQKRAAWELGTVPEGFETFIRTTGHLRIQLIEVTRRAPEGTVADHIERFSRAAGSNIQKIRALAGPVAGAGLLWALST